MNMLAALLIIMAGAVYDETFANANAAYEAGNFDEAVKLYERLTQASVENPVVYYNLGNAYYRNGELARAIANYERALALWPGFEAARENLDKALRGTKRNLARPLPPAWEQSLLFWHYAISYKTARLLAAICWIVFWLLLGLRYARPIPYLRAAAAAAALLACAFAGSAWVKAHPVPLAVALHDETPVRFGRSDAETVRFELFEGDRVTVDRRLNGWARVTTVSGDRGWVRESQLVYAGPGRAGEKEAPDQGAAPDPQETPAA